MHLNRMTPTANNHPMRILLRRLVQNLVFSPSRDGSKVTLAKLMPFRFAAFHFVFGRCQQHAAARGDVDDGVLFAVVAHGGVGVGGEDEDFFFSRYSYQVTKCSSNISLCDGRKKKAYPLSKPYPTY